MADNSRGSILADIWSRLERVFRHVFPGIAIICIARLARPSWFAGFQWGDPWWLFALAVLALVAGNTWLLLHRYSVEQTLDYVVSGLRRHAWKLHGYRVELAERLVSPSGMERSAGREYFFLRSAHASYLFIVGEAAGFFALFPQEHSFLWRWRAPVLWLSVVAIAIALFQWWILVAMDRQLCTKSNEAKGR